MNETKYRKLKKCIEDNNLVIEKVECYDSQSGWTGCHYYVYDGNEHITNKSQVITDLSVNGYCFREDTIDQAIEAINNYLENKKMNTFDAFKKWVEKVAK